MAIQACLREKVKVLDMIRKGGQEREKMSAQFANIIQTPFYPFKYFITV